MGIGHPRLVLHLLVLDGDDKRIRVQNAKVLRVKRRLNLIYLFLIRLNGVNNYNRSRDSGQIAKQMVNNLKSLPRMIVSSIWILLPHPIASLIPMRNLIQRQYGRSMKKIKNLAAPVGGVSLTLVRAKESCSR